MLAKEGLEKYSSQKPAIRLLSDMGYTYLSPEECKAQRGGFYTPTAGRRMNFPRPISSGPWRSWMSPSRTG